MYTVYSVICISQEPIEIVWKERGKQYGTDSKRARYHGQPPELPEGFCIEARWYYRDGEILPVPVDYRQQAETLRNRLLSEARSITSDWQTELSLGIISDDDRLKLTQWMMYIRELNSLNISDIDNKDNFEAINWPAVPETK